MCFSSTCFIAEVSTEAITDLRGRVIEHLSTGGGIRYVNDVYEYEASVRESGP